MGKRRYEDGDFVAFSPLRHLTKANYLNWIDMRLGVIEGYNNGYYRVLDTCEDMVNGHPYITIKVNKILPLKGCPFVFKGTTLQAKVSNHLSTTVAKIWVNHTAPQRPVTEVDYEWVKENMVEWAKRNTRKIHRFLESIHKI